MAAFRPSSFAATGFWPKTGLRPEPQGAGTLAAGAADQGIDAGARAQASSGKIVFDRHSTQSLIAARLRREPGKFSELAVDKGVYKDASGGDESQPAHQDTPEYAGFSMYTARTPAEFRRV